MNKIAIFTDSVADLSDEIKEQYNIISIPHYVRFDYEIYQDGVNLDAEELYQIIKEKKKIPRITSSRFEDFIRIFERYLNFGYDILYIGVGSKLSIAYQNAVMTKEQVNHERIFVVDSNSLSTGLAILVLKAAVMRDHAVPIEIIQQRLTKLVPKVKTQFALKTTDYLVVNEKMNLVKSFASKIVSYKPILNVSFGHLEHYKKSFGQMKKAISIMLEELFESILYLDLEYIVVTHSLANREILYMIEQIKKRIPSIKVVETNAGCVLATECGPGVVGLSYITV